MRTADSNQIKSAHAIGHERIHLLCQLSQPVNSLSWSAAPASCKGSYAGSSKRRAACRVFAGHYVLKPSPRYALARLLKVRIHGSPLRASWSSWTDRGEGDFGCAAPSLSDALFSNTNGGANTAVGYSALYSNTTGYSNTALGNAALGQNSSGIGNSGLGMYALTDNTGGNYNTASGFGAL